MAAKDVLTGVYKSDIPKGGKDDLGNYDLGFTLRAGYGDCVPTGLYNPPDGKCICSIGTLFTPRFLEAKFSATPNANGQDRNCAVIRFPLLNISNLDAFVTQLKACGAVCVNYVGEKWNSIPPKIGGYTPTFAPIFSISTGVRARKVSGVNPTYNSDILGANQAVSVAYEAEPFNLTGASISDGLVVPAGAFETCHGELESGASCGSSGSLKPRKLILGFQYSVAGNDTAKRGIRGVAIESKADILACISTLGGIAGVNCLGYQGEIADRVDLLL
jgi:hypothetical protein